MQRAFSGHSKVKIAGQLVDSVEGERRLRFFKEYEKTTISADHEIIASLELENDGIIFVKQGIWEHRWPFDGFVLARNPLSIYYSLKTYDSVFRRFTEDLLHRFGAVNSAVRLKGNYWRFYRWMRDTDDDITECIQNLSLLEVFCTYYNRRMMPLAEMNLPTVRYESFVRSPEESLRKLCKSLSISFEDSMLALTPNLKGKGHGKNPLDKPISQTSLNKVNRLNQEERDKIMALTVNTWKALGYRESDGKLLPKEVE